MSDRVSLAASEMGIGCIEVTAGLNSDQSFPVPLPFPPLWLHACWQTCFFGSARVQVFLREGELCPHHQVPPFPLLPPSRSFFSAGFSLPPSTSLPKSTLQAATSVQTQPEAGTQAERACIAGFGVWGLGCGDECRGGTMSGD